MDCLTPAKMQTLKIQKFVITKIMQCLKVVSFKYCFTSNSWEIFHFPLGIRDGNLASRSDCPDLIIRLNEDQTLFFHQE
jgi:hypothetical protein